MSDRGQTTIDFAIGTSVFLVTVAFVVAFVPGIFQPFVRGPQEELAGVDRVADTVSRDLLGGSDRSYRIDRDCTVAFFDDSVSDAGCRFDNSESIRDRIGVTDRHELNVTLVGADVDGDGSPDQLCADADHAFEEEGTAGFSCATRLSGGAPVPNDGTSVVARRVVHVGGTDATVLVRMW
ncbi:MAG: hypothetical protein ABEJ82_09570 [Haloplanus sp.]